MSKARQRLLMDFGWRFALGHAGDPEWDFGYGTGVGFAKAGTCGGPAAIDFDAGKWRAIDLPHDWAVELPFDRRGVMTHGFKAIGPAFPENSVGWYRKVFELPKTDAARRLTIGFDGVFRDCRVFLNGHYLGGNLGGYNSFAFGITELADFGGPNVLAVRVDASKVEGWFYEGAGIYRHVWLTKTRPVHVARWGTFVSSKVSRGRATLTVKTRVENDTNAPANCRVKSKIVDPDGKAVGAVSNPAAVPAAGGVEVAQTVKLSKPRLWSLQTPQMYKLITEVRCGRRLADVYETPFGIRTAKFSARKGFLLNGKRVWLKGVCCHQDHAGVGSALPDALQEFRIRRLKEMGCNAYRTSHNPPTPELLDACDRLGMLVMDETRQMGTSREVLAELESMVLRDRNHPSVILWSLGNEEGTIQGTETGRRIAETMKHVVRRLDPTRPVTQAMNGEWGEGFSHVVDVQGCNYIQCGKVDEFHDRFPDKPVVYSEACSTVCTRGQYGEDEKKCYVSAYDVNFPVWGCGAETMWKHTVERPWLDGIFVWTGFDYRGEPTPYRRWPCINSHFGIMDTCGFAKDNFYYCKAQWRDEPLVHIVPHWNWRGKKGKYIDVWVHTNCRRVELLLNGRSLGTKSVEPNGHAEWQVRYQPGTLEARGYNNGKPIAECVVQTAGRPAAVVLLPDRRLLKADGEDAAVVNAAVVDSSGLIVPTASNEVRFSIKGPGRIIGVGNGNPASHEADKADRRKAFCGLCQVIVQTNRRGGRITLTAGSAKLKTASVVLQAKRTGQRPFVPSVE
ncbi:MAG: beta-galactosidase GalA [Planctomycetota bacterium]|jgi:beta-galactosidase